MLGRVPPGPRSPSRCPCAQYFPAGVVGSGRYCVNALARARGEVEQLLPPILCRCDCFWASAPNLSKVR